MVSVFLNAVMSSAIHDTAAGTADPTPCDINVGNKTPLNE